MSEARIHHSSMKIIDRGTYGWAEFIAAAGCQTEEELERFYERQGGYLALLYALEATDFHHENLIANGEHPVLIDLEALFHPRVSGLEKDSLSNLVLEKMGYSVVRIGLLPQRVWAYDDSGGV